MATTAVIVFSLGIAFSGIKSYSSTLRISRSIDCYRDTVHMISKTAEPGFVAIGGWSKGILFEHYLFRKSYTSVWINTEWLDGTWGKDRQRKSWRQFKTATAEGREIWLLGPQRQDLDTLLLDSGYTITPFRCVDKANKALHGD